MLQLLRADRGLPYEYVSVEGPVVAIEPVDEEERRLIARRYLGTEAGDAYITATASEERGSVMVRMRPWLRWRPPSPAGSAHQAVETRSREDNGPMRKIDVFAHILPGRYLERLEAQLASTIGAAQLRYYQDGVFHFDPVLTDLDARWRKIEAYGDYAQVLVLAVPPLEEVGPPRVAAELARQANDEMAELVARFPERFVGFAAALPLSDVDASLEEMDRAAGDLGALGFQLFTNVLGAPLDHPRFDPILTQVEALDRTVWLHPTRNATWPDYPAERESDFGIWWSLGWPYETAAALSRLVYSGQMERHPGLRVIAHHGGGMVPHFAARLAMGPGYRQTKDRLPLPPLNYFRRFYADTALFGAPHAVRCVLDFFGPEHVLFGTDIPLGPPHAVEATIADLDAAGLAEADLAAVHAGNARRLLGVR